MKTTKVLQLALITLCVFGFCACSKEPSNNEQPAAEGRMWKVAKVDYYVNHELVRSVTDDVTFQFDVFSSNKVYVYQGSLTFINSVDEMYEPLYNCSYSVWNSTIIFDEESYKIIERDKNTIVLQETYYKSNSKQIIVGTVSGRTIYAHSEKDRLLGTWYYVDNDGTPYKCYQYYEGDSDYDYEFCRYTFELVEE